MGGVIGAAIFLFAIFVVLLNWPAQEVLVVEGVPDDVVGAPVANNLRNVLPISNLTYDLGTTTPAQEWLNIYTQDIFISGTCTGCPSGTGEANQIATSSAGVISSLLYYTTAAATPELVDPVATTSLSAGTGLSASAALGALVGGANSTLSVDASQTQITALGTITTGVWDATTIAVDAGGTGAETFTDGGVLFGSGTGAFTASAVLSNGQLLIGDNSTDPALATLTATANETEITNGAGTITIGLPDAVTIATLTLTNDLTVANGGTGASTLTGILEGNGTSAFTANDSSTVGQVLRVTGASTFAFGALDLADADAITGTLPIANGGTAATSLDDILGTSNEIDVANGANTIIGGDSTLTISATLDLGGNTSLEIVNATAPTHSAVGQISLDTSDLQFLISTSTNALGTAVIRTTTRIFAFSLASTSPEFFNGGIQPVPTERDGYVVTEYSCYVTAGTSVVLTLTDGSNAMDSITCLTTNTTDTAISVNQVVTAGELMQMNVGAISGTVDYVNFSAYGTWTRE